MFWSVLLPKIWRAETESHTPTEWVVHNMYFDADRNPGTDFRVDFVAHASGDSPAHGTFFIEGA
ncbi:hypothetical protein DPMN_162139 [Dreissena polymorpha]|uniref:Uncharacterized protein n=1 Tax=Dreissena polymorpha TaxID=45954 RepID=A0A9D4EUI4_DREPO|nr:hypothetical protein DPMN_162139 [Dreissena polymorpha]